MGIQQLSDGKCEFVVQGFTFQQNPRSPKLFAFVASANDLVKFCGVARKSQDLLTNYQRALDTIRVAKEVTPFFRVPENCTPTAVVLSLQQTNVAEIEFKPFGTSAAGSSVGLDTLTLRFLDMEKAPPEQVVELARKFLDSRLGQDKDETTVAQEGTQNRRRWMTVCNHDLRLPKLYIRRATRLNSPQRTGTGSPLQEPTRPGGC